MYIIYTINHHHHLRIRRTSSKIVLPCLVRLIQKTHISCKVWRYEDEKKTVEYRREKIRIYRKKDCLLIQIMYNHITNLQNNVLPTISPKTTTFFEKKRKALKTEKKPFFVHNKLTKTQEREKTDRTDLFVFVTFELECFIHDTLHNISRSYVYTTYIYIHIWLPFQLKVSYRKIG